MSLSKFKKCFILIILYFNVTLHQSIEGPISKHFDNWLVNHGYGDYDFNASKFGRIGSFGGKNYHNVHIRNRPVVFVHGNTDGALDDGSEFGSGWNSNIEAFLNKGYNMAELYGTTWSDRIQANAANQTLSCNYVMKVRNFLLAVLKYTKYGSINVVAHSMGVPLTRKAIKGGHIYDVDGECYIGKSISSKINTFVSIAAPNYGLCLCKLPFLEATPSCNKLNGYWPGDSCSYEDCVKLSNNTCTQTNYSRFLKDLNEDMTPESKYLLNIYSNNDTLLGIGNLVFNNKTSRFSSPNEEVTSGEWNHMETKEKSFTYTIDMIKRHDHKNDF